MNKEILRLAVPNILSNISVPLLSSVDTILMGTLSGLHIGAVGLGAMIFNFIYWNFGFLRMGTTGITAQANGKEDATEMINTLGRALLVGSILAVLILLFQVPIGKLSFLAMNVSPEQEEFVKTYFYTRVWAAPATLGLYAIFGWFFGMQNSIFPLVLTIILNIVNIIFSWYFVHIQGLEVAGVAMGTVIAQYVGFIAALFLFLFKYKNLLSHFKKEILFKVEELQKFLRINRDIFIRTVALTLTFSFFYSKSSAEGTLILAANTILMHFFNWMAYGIDGFAFASESMVGKYKGKGNPIETNRAIKYSFGWGMGFALFFSALFYIFGIDLLYIFTDKEDVILAATPYLLWLVFIPIISTPSFIWDGVFIGLTASASMRNSMIVSAIGFFIAYYFLQPLYGNHGLWAAMYVYMLFRGIIQHSMYWRNGVNMT